MATAGLGQGTQVFDFSGIGKQGLMLDDRKEAKEQAFFDRNKDLYNPMTADGIRDTDAPFINAELEKAMQLSAKAAQTKDPADVQAAMNARTRVSSMTAESVAARNAGFETMAEVRKTPEYTRNKDKFEAHFREHQAATAMNSSNGGKVGENIIFQAPVFYNLEKGLSDFVDIDAQDVLRGSYETKGTGTQRADGTGYSSKTSQLNEELRDQRIVDKYQSQYAINPDFQIAVEAQVMSQMYGTTDLDESQVARFTELKNYGAELHSRFDDIKDLANDREFKHDPLALSKAQKAFSLKEDVYNQGLELYADAVRGKAVKATSKVTQTDNSPNASGSSSKSDGYALSSGKTPEEAVGGSTTFKSNAIPQSTGQTIGYTSIEGMKLKPRGTGTEKVLVGGVMANVTSDGKLQGFYAVEYKPSPDILKKIEEGADVSGLLQKMDANVVPLQSARAGIISDDIQRLQVNAMNQAGMSEADIKAYFDPKSENTEENTDKPAKPTI